MERMPELAAKVEYGRGGVVRRGDYAINPAEALTQLEERVVNGRFRLLRWLGGTKTSAVYLTAFDGNPPRMAALKLVAASDPDAEIRLAGWNAAAQLSHKNLMGVIDCGRCEIDRCKFVFQVMDYADEILAELLPVRPLTADEAREMLGTVLNALGYLHAHGYVHGRIKPSNILVVNDRLKLSGDSIALASGSTGERAQTSMYEAPELGRGTVTPAVDVWALGMTLVAALTQRPAQWERGYQDEPIIPAGIVEPFRQIVWSCLQVNPADRCTLEEIKGILDPGSAPPVAARRLEESNTTEARRPVGSWKTALIAAVAVVVVAGTALIVRTTEFSPKGTRSSDQQTAASDSVRTPPPRASNADSTPAHTPQVTIEKPSPSGHGTIAAPETKASAAPASISSGGESNGVLLRVNPEIQPTAQQSIRGQVNVGVRVKVDAAGDVTDAQLESQSGSNYFNRVAVDAARQWKFAAGPGGAWQVRFQFRHDGTDLSATRE
jgi:TonB family protein